MTRTRIGIGLATLALGVALGAGGASATAIHAGTPVRVKGTVLSVSRATNRITLRVGTSRDTFVTNTVTVVTVHHAASTLAALKKGQVATVTGVKLGPIETAQTITVA